MTATRIDLSTSLGGISLPTCLYNASGPRSGTVEALKKVASSSGSGAVLSKSATLIKQSGNPQPRIHHEDHASYNSEGLPNQGIDYYIDASNMDDIRQATATDNDDKPYFVSLSGKTLQDNLEMLQRIVNLSDESRSKIASIELNLACPNIVGKPTLAYDMDQLQDVLKAVIDCLFGGKKKNKPHPPKLGVKLPPYLDRIQLESVAQIINQHHKLDGDVVAISYITTVNTIGNALCIDVSVQQPYIAANSGLAGLSGRALHATALANVYLFRQCLLPSIDICGVGGIETGQDVIAMVLAGAKAVQIGTTHWKEGPACFDRIANETRAWLQQHGHDSISQVYNQLQPWSKERANQARELRKKAAASSKTQTAESGASSIHDSSSAQFWKLISAVLVVVVALLCADKWHGSLLPQEQS